MDVMDVLRGLIASFTPRRARSALTFCAGSTALAFLAIETYKHWPCSYHVRLIGRLFQCRFFPRRLFGLDVPIVYRGRVRLSDLDVHLHMTNGQCVACACARPPPPFLCFADDDYVIHRHPFSDHWLATAWAGRGHQPGPRRG